MISYIIRMLLGPSLHGAQALAGKRWLGASAEKEVSRSK